MTKQLKWLDKSIGVDFLGYNDAENLAKQLDFQKILCALHALQAIMILLELT